MKFLIIIAVGCLSVLPLAQGAEKPANSHTNAAATEEVTVVLLSESAVEKAAATGETIGRLLKAVPPTIGVTYRWGHADLENGIDCSNYTWQLFKKVGLPYERYLNTQKMSTLKKGYGLHQVSFDEIAAGDLLVYGYRDDKEKWHGHVVIAVDLDGKATGHKGLVLGAHGGAVGKVQFVTYKGFTSGYFRNPQMRLCNVLRSDEAGDAGSEKVGN